MYPALDIQRVILWQRCQAKSLWQDEVLGSKRAPGSKGATAPCHEDQTKHPWLSHRTVTHHLAFVAPWILLGVLGCDYHSLPVS